MTQPVGRMGFMQGQEDLQSDTLRSRWCRVMHDAPMWPIHGHYQCGVCGTRFPVPWEKQAAPVVQAAAMTPARQAM